MANKCFLREGDDALEKARKFPSVESAREAFAETARELGRIGQAHSATIHIASEREDLAEYPDFVLSVGPRGGIVMEPA